MECIIKKPLVDFNFRTKKLGEITVFYAVIACK